MTDQANTLDVTMTLAKVRQALADTDGFEAAAKAVVDVLQQAVSHYAWVGIYRADEAAAQLQLAARAGGDTPHQCIDFTHGGCGPVLSSAKTHVFEAHASPKPLVCNTEIQAQALVPVFNRRGRVSALLDVQSRQPGAFAANDLGLLTAVAGLLGPHS
jgi:GAF domain-containing protein